MQCMMIEDFWEDEYIAQAHECWFPFDKWKNTVNGSLNGVRGIADPNWHSHELEGAVMANERSNSAVGWIYFNFPVARVSVLSQNDVCFP